MADNPKITEVECPVVGRKIKDIECIECREIVDGNYPEKYLVDGFKDRRDWKGACRECKWHKF